MPELVEQKRILALDASDPRTHFADRNLEIRFCRTPAEASEIAISWKPAALCILVEEPEDKAAGLLRACRSVSSLYDVPAIALVSTRSGDWHRLMEAGFTSFIKPPIEAKENRQAIAGIGKLPASVNDREILAFQDVRMDVKDYKVWRGEHRLDIPILQFELLKLLLQNPGRVFSKEELMERLWRDKTIDIHTVNTCCMRLRRSLCSKGGPNLLQNVRGRGYTLDVD